MFPASTLLSALAGGLLLIPSSSLFQVSLPLTQEIITALTTLLEIKRRIENIVFVMTNIQFGFLD